jgi:GAF domain-containing protein
VQHVSQGTELRFEGERLGRILEDRNQILELVACGAPLRELLERLCRSCEDAEPGLLCSVLLVDDEGKRLMNGAAPSLPAFYNEAVNGLTIGPEAGSCGSAAFKRSRVVVEDVMSDPRWVSFRELAQRAELRACWSQPIFSSRQDVLGTFAMYYRKPRLPSVLHVQFIESFAHIAGVAIERDRNQRELEAYRNELEARVAIRTAELEKANQDLRRAMSDIKVLSGMLPICSACKRVRDDSGYWAQIESYIAERSQAEFTHGICPDCAGKFYPAHRRSEL